MTMEYFNFVITIAAVSLVLVLVWRLGVSVWKGKQPNSDLNAKPFPPLKKTISGLSRKELEQIDFQGRIDVWQRDHEVRRNRLNDTDVPLSGKKYTYIRPEKSRVAATGG
jgi:hypothetical protein